MCEPWILQKTALLVTEHQRRTLDNFLSFEDLAPPSAPAWGDQETVPPAVRRLLPRVAWPLPEVPSESIATVFRAADFELSARRPPSGHLRSGGVSVPSASERIFLHLSADGVECGPMAAEHRPAQVSDILQRLLFPPDEDEGGKLGFVSRLIVTTTLPHSQPADNEFVRHSGLYELSLLAPRSVGLPSGRYPRLVLAWIITEAVKRKTPRVLLGRSFSSFAFRIGITPTTGPRGSLVQLRDQVHRLVNLNVAAIGHGAENPKYGLPPAFSGGGVRLFSKYLLWWDDPPPSPDRPSFVLLSQEFFDEILAHPIPIDLEVLRRLRSPLEMDVYMWLTYRSMRARRIQRPEPVSWEALEQQFGADYSELRMFRYNFLRALKKVLKIYPEAQITSSQHGLVLHPFSPHIGRLPMKR